MNFQNNIRDSGAKNLFESSNASLGRQVSRGGVWVFSGRILQRVLGLVRTIILARLLAPTDFGLFGIALLALSALDTFSRTGFGQALIQKKGETRSYLDTAWTVGVIRGIAIAAILFCVAPLVATFFKAPPAEPILKVIGLAIIVQSFTNIAIIYFEKELKFHKYFAYQLVGTVIDLAVAVSAAFILRSVWALVFGCLAGNLARCTISYVIDPYRPRFRLDSQKAKELFGFGKWILGSTILLFFLNQGDDIFVGKLLGATMLGFYQMAYRISNLPATEYSHLIATVMFPAYSKMQDDLRKFRKAYLKVLQLTALISVPVAGLIFVLARDFTVISLGEKWMPMVPAMRVLALYGMLRAIGATTGVVFMAVGKPEIRTKIQSAQLIFLAVLIYPFIMRWGIVGAAMAVTAYALVFNLVAVYKVLDIVKSGLRKPVKLLVFPSIGTLIMICVIHAVRARMGETIGIVSFLLLAGLGAFAYILITYLFDLFFDYGSRQLIREQLAVFSEKRG